MKPFHSLFPEIAQKQVRCLIVGPYQGTAPEPAHSLPADKYIFSEFFCADLTCDCRQAFLQVISEGQPEKVFACINVGWDDEAYYRKRCHGDRELAANLVRGSLDPINKQSEFAGQILELFQSHIKTTPYLLRLRRHSRLFREEVRRRRILEK